MHVKQRWNGWVPWMTIFKGVRKQHVRDALMSFVKRRWKQPCPVTEECHQFLFDKEKVLCGPVYNAITKADNDEKAHTRDQLNGFWSKTARNEKKKRRKPLIVAESRERKVKKLKSEIIHRMNSLDKPVVPLIKKLKEMDPSGSYTV